MLFISWNKRSGEGKEAGSREEERERGIEDREGGGGGEPSLAYSLDENRYEL
jgi:hypothetical protein